MKKTKTEYEYWRVPIEPVERRKLLILVAKRNCSTIPELLRSLMLDALKKAEKDNLFANLDFLEQKQQEQK